MAISEMIQSARPEGNSPPAELARCIEACLECGATCQLCADACLSGDMVAELKECITLNLNCADVCSTTAALLARQSSFCSEVVPAVLTACKRASRACAEECEQHSSMHGHCRICAEICRQCVNACDELLAIL